MDLSPSFLTYWYFHLPNYVLAVLFYTLLGRFILGLFVDPASSNYIWRFFRRLTDPILRVIDVIIPAFLIAPVRPLAAAFHLYLARIVFWLTMYNLGLAPRVAEALKTG